MLIFLQFFRPRFARPHLELSLSAAMYTFLQPWIPLSNLIQTICSFGFLNRARILQIPLWQFTSMVDQVPARW